MADLSPKRNWSPESIGTVERANPLGIHFYQGDSRADLLPRIIEARIEFRREHQQSPSIDVEALARKALWRHIHAGLDDPLFQVLEHVRRAASCLPPTDPTQFYLREAGDQLKALIDHVLGNPHGGWDGPEHWADVEYPVTPKPCTVFQPAPEEQTDEPGRT